MKKILASVATLTALVAATPAFAQAGPSQSANATASAEIVTPIAISNLDGMSFGRLAANATAGTVSLGALGALTSSAPNMVIAGSTGNVPTFNVTGQAGLLFNISIPASASLLSGANSMSVALSGPSVGTLSVGGTASFDVTGVLSVGASQAAGNYTGTFAASVQYQ